jgi:cellulose synthase (UDP-forming)
MEYSKKIRVFSRTDNLIYVLFLSTWLIVNITFWYWWFFSSHQGNPILFTLVSLAIFYDGTFLPSAFLYYIGHLKRPIVPKLKTKPDFGKIAIITLTVPGSESLSIVAKQLKAMRAVKYPHDSWILVDKEHSPQIKSLAKKYGVNYFCRHDISTWGSEKVNHWNQENPPFKTKTKAGNVNSWLEAFGDQYRYFTQLDIDHIPKPNYLNEVLPLFSHPKIAWVQAPSVYHNFRHWTARGSAEQELVLQGPLQMSFYGASETPFIIGSHSTYRMEAIRQIGGFQPTRAEDHLDTVYLAAAGYRGVYLPKIIAVGDGPENFETYLAQQFAWSFSLMQVLLFHTPKIIKKMPRSIALQLLFSETWYPLWSVSMFILFIAPLLSLLFNQQIAQLSFWEFSFRSILINSVALLSFIWTQKWHQPKRLTLSWRSILLHVARWYIVLAAIIQAIMRVKKPYMVTQKGVNGDYSLNPKALQPYFFLALISLLISFYYLVFVKSGPGEGYLLYSLEGAALMVLVSFIPIALTFNKLALNTLLKNRYSLFMTGSVFSLFLLTSYYSGNSLREIYLPQNTLFLTQQNSLEKLSSQSPSLASLTDNSLTYEVQRGDNLWKIAQNFYGNGRCWPQLSVNGSKLIHAGDQLEIKTIASNCHLVGSTPMFRNR